MNSAIHFFHTIQHDTIEVAVWQVLTILTVATICMLIRGSKMGLLITYVFTLQIAFSFFKLYFSMPILIVIGIFAILILLVGLYEAFTDN